MTMMNYRVPRDANAPVRERFIYPRPPIDPKYFQLPQSALIQALENRQRVVSEMRRAAIRGQAWEADRNSSNMQFKYNLGPRPLLNPYPYDVHHSPYDPTQGLSREVGAHNLQTYQDIAEAGAMLDKTLPPQPRGPFDPKEKEQEEGDESEGYEDYATRMANDYIQGKSK